MVFHVLNRGVGRRTLFEKAADYLAFLNVFTETLRTRPMRICAYCLMPNHWHMVLWPENDGDMPAFMQQLTNTHVKRWKEHYHENGYGHLYQGRYKSFPVQTEEYFYNVAHYVERNPVRAGLADRVELWPWSSAGCVTGDNADRPALSQWPLPRPLDWQDMVNHPQAEREMGQLRKCVNRGCPLGDADWVEKVAKRLGLEYTLRPRGRPRGESSLRGAIVAG
jgi:putative transposase